MSVDVWGEFKSGYELEVAARDTLKLWFPAYLREIEARKQLGTSVLPLPQSYLIAEEIDREYGAEMPCIVVVSPGLSGQRPRKEGDGSYSAFFNLGIAVFVAANSSENTKRLVRLYTMAARLIMLNKQSLGGFTNGINWIDESYDDRFPFTDSETTSAGQVLFEVEVPDMVSRGAGPATPDVPPLTQWGIAEEVDIDVVKEDLP